jgi:hypothetical protein
METAVKENKANYKEIIRDILKGLEGPLTYQDVENVVVPSPSHQRFFLLAIGFDEGEEVLEIVIAVSITDDNKVKIEKNYADIDLTRALLARGIPYADIIQ